MLSLILSVQYNFTMFICKLLDKNCNALVKLVSLEENKEMKRLQKEGQRDVWIYDVQQVIRKAHLIFQLR